jgi:hypothetical protein
MKTISIDFENNAETFWDAVKESLPAAPLGPAARKVVVALAGVGGPDDLEVADEVADEVEAWFSTLPGWADPDAPAYADRPVIISPVPEESAAEYRAKLAADASNLGDRVMLVAQLRLLDEDAQADVQARILALGPTNGLTADERTAIAGQYGVGPDDVEERFDAGLAVHYWTVAGIDGTYLCCRSDGAADYEALRRAAAK